MSVFDRTRPVDGHSCREFLLAASGFASQYERFGSLGPLRSHFAEAWEIHCIVTVETQVALAIEGLVQAADAYAFDAAHRRVDARLVYADGMGTTLNHLAASWFEARSRPRLPAARIQLADSMRAYDKLVRDLNAARGNLPRQRVG